MAFIEELLLVKLEARHDATQTIHFQLAPPEPLVVAGVSHIPAAEGSDSTVQNRESLADYGRNRVKPWFLTGLTPHQPTQRIDAAGDVLSRAAERIEEEFVADEKVGPLSRLGINGARQELVGPLDHGVAAFDLTDIPNEGPSAIVGDGSDEYHQRGRNERQRPTLCGARKCGNHSEVLSCSGCGLSVDHTMAPIAGDIGYFRANGIASLRRLPPLHRRF
jgi:hypothetical protein